LGTPVGPYSGNFNSIRLRDPQKRMGFGGYIIKLKNGLKDVVVILLKAKLIVSSHGIKLCDDPGTRDN